MYNEQNQYVPAQENKLTASIVLLVFSIIFTNPGIIFGILGIVKSSIANNAYAAGNYDIYETNLAKAKKFLKIGWIISIICALLYVALFVFYIFLIIAMAAGGM